MLGDGVLDNFVVHLLLMLGALGAFFLFLMARNYHQKKKRLLEPHAPETRHRPGHAISREIDQLKDKLRMCIIAMVTSPVLVLLVHFAYSYFGKVPESLQRSVISAAGVSVFAGFYLFKFIWLHSMRLKRQSAYDDELAVARELSMLSPKGYHVYHDVPGETFKIDHVVVGASGVMTVETVTRSRGASPGRKKDAIVTYDGRMLHFPKYSDHRIVDEAKNQAIWLSQWLSSAVGKDICARAMVTMPGWFVKRTSADGIPVVNPKQIETLFAHIKPRPLTEEMVGRICESIERRCLAEDPQGNGCMANI